MLVFLFTGIGQNRRQNIGSMRFPELRGPESGRQSKIRPIFVLFHQFTVLDVLQVASNRHTFCEYHISSPLSYTNVRTMLNPPETHYEHFLLLQDQVKNEITRVRQAMVRDKEVQDKKMRPVLDKAAAGRFIRHNLHERKPTDKELLAPKNKKRKINEI